MLKINYNITASYPLSCGLIFLNFSTSHFGCGQHCPFCIYSMLDWTEYWYPNKEDIQDYLKLFPKGGTISISGGGDPLFQITKNKEKLAQLISWVKEEGYYIDLVTSYWMLIPKHYDVLKDIDSWSFSIETLNPQLKEVVTFLRQHNKNVRITKLVNPTGPIDWEKLEEWVDFYHQKRVHLILRENFSFSLSLKNQKQVSEWCAHKGFIGLKFSPRNLTHLVLINNEVWDSNEWYNKMEQLAIQRTDFQNQWKKTADFK